MESGFVDDRDTERGATHTAHGQSATYVNPSPAMGRPEGLADGPARVIAFPRAGEVRSARPYNRRLFVELARSADVAVAVVLLGATYLAANADGLLSGWEAFLLLRLNVVKLLQLGVFAVLWQQVFLRLGLYDMDRAPSLRDEAPRVITACTLGTMVSFGFSLLSESGAFSVGIPLLAWTQIVLATLTVRYALRRVADRRQPSDVPRVLIVGSGPLAHRLHLQVLDRQAAGECELVGFVDSNPTIQFPEIQERLLGNLDRLEELLMHLVVDEVLVALPIKSHYAQIQRVIEDCEQAGVQSRYSADVFRTRIANPRVELSHRHPAVAMQVAPDDHRLVIKRMIDVVGAAIGLVLMVPLFAAIALAITLTSPGPIFFAQERYGWRKRRFRMLKFRTMVSDAEALQPALECLNEAGGPVFKIRNDPRITRLGRLLRRTSLDELPQLWNVLRGEMSLVGPRPLPARDVGRFCEAWLMRRFSVTPGITGLWQVSGRSDVRFDRWVALDLEYIDHWSLRLDLLILLRTLPAVLRTRGAV
jgi:exopolysaccharide biosynthesis polyprenyl glycosylphosphotransferase